MVSKRDEKLRSISNASLPSSTTLDCCLPELEPFLFCDSKARLIAEESRGHSSEDATGVEGLRLIVLI